MPKILATQEQQIDNANMIFGVIGKYEPLILIPCMFFRVKLRKPSATLISTISTGEIGIPISLRPLPPSKKADSPCEVFVLDIS